MNNYSDCKFIIEVQQNIDRTFRDDSREHFGVDEEKLERLWAWARLYYAPPLFGETAPPHRPLGLKPTPVELLDLTLVHMVRYGASSVLEQQSCQKVMRNWEVLSCSLVNHRTGLPAAISSVGFALRVPAQNIIGAHPGDVFFPNHIGIDYEVMPYGPKRVTEAALLSEAIRYGVTKRGDTRDASGNRISFVKMATPIELSAVWGHQSYNEVLVVGRPAVNVHGLYRCTPRREGFVLCSATQDVIPRFIIIYPSGSKFDKVRASGLTMEPYYQNCWAQACRLRKVNQNLAIKVAQVRAPGWNWGACEGKRASDGFI